MSTQCYCYFGLNIIFPYKTVKCFLIKQSHILRTVRTVTFSKDDLLSARWADLWDQPKGPEWRFVLKQAGLVSLSSLFFTGTSARCTQIRGKITYNSMFGKMRVSRTICLRTTCFDPFDWSKTLQLITDSFFIIKVWFWNAKIFCCC